MQSRLTVPHDVARKHRKKALQQVKPVEETVKKSIKLAVIQGFSHNKSIDAGFTYLGQLIAHDLSYPLINNQSFKTALNLQTLYGSGVYSDVEALLRLQSNIQQPYEPAFNPDQSIVEAASFRYRRKLFAYDDDQLIEHVDFIRDAQQKAILKDARNDNNFIIAQITLTWMRFHNQICGYLYASKSYATAAELFKDARLLVAACYRDVVVQQYLKLMTSANMVDELLSSNRNFQMFRYKQPPILMPEFSEAAFRMGHSQVRKSYKFHETHDEFPVFSSNPETMDLRGSIDRLDSDKSIALEWRFLFRFKTDDDQTLPSSSIDHLLTPSLFHLPDDTRLVELDIEKNDLVGSCFVNAMRVSYYDCLCQQDLEKILEREGNHGTQFGNVRNLPLGLYVLLEAEILNNGKTLGPVGGRIIAEQITWAAKNIPRPPKVVMARLTDWRRQTEPDHLTIQDIITFVIGNK
ncbi:MAG: hypothetical protein IT269_05555 [Saprospiraceae bacterium]|nr:hypothetical protein [Saprospiraceae bacterium]